MTTTSPALSARERATQAYLAALHREHCSPEAAQAQVADAMALAAYVPAPDGLVPPASPANIYALIVFDKGLPKLDIPVTRGTPHIRNLAELEPLLNYVVAVVGPCSDAKPFYLCPSWLSQRIVYEIR